jgi:hypothetical protein
VLQINNLSGNSWEDGYLCPTSYFPCAVVQTFSEIIHSDFVAEPLSGELQGLQNHQWEKSPLTCFGRNVFTAMAKMPTFRLRDKSSMRGILNSKLPGAGRRVNLERSRMRRAID